MPAPATRRDWAGPTDLPALIRLAQRIRSPDSRWHIGDFAWKFGLEPAGRPTWQMSMWKRDGDIVAWGWLTRPDRLSLAMDPVDIDLLDAVVGGRRKPLGSACPSSSRPPSATRPKRWYGWDTRPMRVAISLSRTIDRSTTFHRARRCRTDSGSGACAVAARATLHREVWSSTDLTEDVSRAMKRQWPYSVHFDWVAEAPDGRTVTFQPLA